MGKFLSANHLGSFDSGVNQPSGEQGFAALDINLDGNIDFFDFPASTRSSNHLIQNPVNVFSFGEQGQRVETGLSESFLNELTTGWLQNVSVVDLNGDGYDDLFYSGHGREWPVGLEGSDDDADYEELIQDPNFSDNWPGDHARIVLANPNPKVETITDSPRFYHSADVGDYDNDGDLDIGVIAFDYPPFKGGYLYLNDGLGNFEEGNFSPWFDRSFSDKNLEIFNDSSVMEFFDSGGLTSLVVGSGGYSEPTSYGYESLVVETFDGDQKIVSRIPYESFQHIVPDYDILGVDKIRAADLDMDGDEDLIIKFTDGSDGANPLSLIFETQTPDVFQVHTYPGQHIGSDGPYAIDVNGDSLPDIVHGGWPGLDAEKHVISDRIFINQGGVKFASLRDVYGDTLQNELAGMIGYPTYETDFGLESYDINRSQFGPVLSTLTYSDQHEGFEGGKVDFFTLAVHADALLGNDGDDAFDLSTLSAGYVDGGDGVDTLSIPEVQSELVRLGEHWQVSGQTLTNVERLEFTDKMVALDFEKGENSFKAAALITTMFGSDLIPTYFAPAVDLIDQGSSIDQIAQLAIDLGLVDASSNENFFANVYENVVGVEADPSTQALYVSQLDSGELSHAGLVAIGSNASIIEAQMSELATWRESGLDYLEF